MSPPPLQEPTRGLEPRTPSLRVKGPPRANRLQIGTFSGSPVSPSQQYHSAFRAFGRGPLRVAPPPGASAGGRAARVREEDLSRGIPALASTSGHGPDSASADIAAPVQHPAGRERARRLGANPAALHRLWTNRVPSTSGRPLPNTARGDRQLLGRARSGRSTVTSPCRRAPQGASHGGSSRARRRWCATAPPRQAATHLRPVAGRAGGTARTVLLAASGSTNGAASHE